jgi:hypothetical protein
MSAILKYVGDHDRFNIRTILGPKKFREQYDRLAITYRDWLKKKSGVNKLTRGQYNPVNVKPVDSDALKEKALATVEKMRRMEEERRKLTSLTATHTEAEHEAADAGTVGTYTPSHPHSNNSASVQKIRGFLGNFGPITPPSNN